MTEAEWLACPDPRSMLGFVYESMSDRKRRLLAVAAARAVWHLLVDPRSRATVELAERLADGVGTWHDLACAWDEADKAQFAIWDDGRGEAAEGQAGPWEASLLARWTAEGTDQMAHEPLPLADLVVPPGELAAILRDLVRIGGGKPMRMLGADANRLALHAYEGRDWSVLPILADALEEEGCDDAVLLEHLRSPGPHVRGCWALDLVLSQE